MKLLRNIPPKSYSVYDLVSKNHALPWADFPARCLLWCYKDLPFATRLWGSMKSLHVVVQPHSIQPDQRTWSIKQE